MKCLSDGVIVCGLNQETVSPSVSIDAEHRAARRGFQNWYSASARVVYWTKLTVHNACLSAKANNVFLPAVAEVW